MVQNWHHTLYKKSFNFFHLVKYIICVTLDDSILYFKPHTIQCLLPFSASEVEKAELILETTKQSLESTQ